MDEKIIKTNDILIVIFGKKMNQSERNKRRQELRAMEGYEIFYEKNGCVYLKPIDK